MAPCDYDTTPSYILDPIKVIDFSKKSKRYDFNTTVNINNINFIFINIIIKLLFQDKLENQY